MRVKGFTKDGHVYAWRAATIRERIMFAIAFALGFYRIDGRWTR